MSKELEGTKEAPEILNQEDEKFLQDLEAKGVKLEGRGEEPKPEEPKLEEKKEEETKTEEKEEKIEEKTEEEPKSREPKFIEAWRLKVAEKKWEQEKEQLISELQTLKTKTPDSPESRQEQVKGIKELAEKYNIDETLVSEMFGVFKSQIALPEDIKKDLERWKNSQKETIEELEFTKDFNANVLPLLQAEYPDLQQSEIDALKVKVKQHAYSPKFLNTPLDVLYKGIDEFRSLKPKDSRSLEPSRGKSGTKVTDYSKVTEEDVKTMSREDQEKYFSWIDSQGLKA